MSIPFLPGIRSSSSIIISCPISLIERAAERWLDALTESREASPDAEADLHHFLERALAQSGSRLPDFLRLQMLLSLEGGEPRPDLLERMKSKRAIVGGEGNGGIIVPELHSGRDALLGMALANGALLFRHMEPDGIDVDRLAGDLEVAILAVARQRLSEGDS